MTVFLNGEFVPEERAVVSIFDRSFLYGDGLFEAVRIHNGQLFRFDAHLERLQRGAAFLKIDLPISPRALRKYSEQLITANGVGEAVMRITLSRGVGVRGYSPQGATQPALAMSLTRIAESPTTAPRRWRVITSSVRVMAADPLAQFKTCNKLHHVLARAEADVAGVDEALLLNSDGNVAEATSSNLFWIRGRSIWTTPITAGILPGVTRAVLRELCPALGFEYREGEINLEGLRTVDGAFLTLTTFGVVPILSLDGFEFPACETISRICHAYSSLLENETRQGQGELS